MAVLDTVCAVHAAPGPQQLSARRHCLRRPPPFAANCDRCWEEPRFFWCRECLRDRTPPGCRGTAYWAFGQFAPYTRDPQPLQAERHANLKACGYTEGGWRAAGGAAAARRVRAPGPDVPARCPPLCLADAVSKARLPYSKPAERGSLKPQPRSQVQLAVAGRLQACRAGNVTLPATLRLSGEGGTQSTLAAAMGRMPRPAFSAVMLLPPAVLRCARRVCVGGARAVRWGVHPPRRCRAGCNSHSPLSLSRSAALLLVWAVEWGCSGRARRLGRGGGK